jgi:3-amino-5-hydroxybenzoate synthase
VANGTLAIECALTGLGIGPGDEVLVPGTTFISTALAVSRVGASPVPVDIDPETYCVDLHSAEQLVRPATRCLVVVHLAGHPADLTGARRLADQHGLYLVEDSAQAVTASWEGRQVGSVGDASVLSFQAGKLLPGGDGGAVLIRDDGRAAEVVERYANCGRRRGSGDYDHSLLATNARISEFGAAVVLAQLEDYEALRSIRDRTARSMIASLATIDDRIARPLRPEVDRHDWYMLMLRVSEACAAARVSNTAFAAALTAEGIEARVIYPAWHLTEAYAGLGFDDSSCAESRRVGDEVVWLHHRLLLDSAAADALAAAVGKIERSAAELAAWGGDRVA